MITSFLSLVPPTNEISEGEYGVVPAPDGTIYLVDINGTH